MSVRNLKNDRSIEITFQRQTATYQIICVQNECRTIVQLPQKELLFALTVTNILHIIIVSICFHDSSGSSLWTYGTPLSIVQL